MNKLGKKVVKSLREDMRLDKLYINFNRFTRESPALLDFMF